MALDSIKNKAWGILTAGISSTDTTFNVQTGQGTRFPTSGAFNVVVWNNTDYPNPAEDTNYEIIRVTISGDTFTVVGRGQEDTVAQDHNIVGKQYRVGQMLTAKMITDISADINTKQIVLTPTAVKTTNYTVGPNEFVPVDNSGGNVIITLPAAPADKTIVEVKIIKTADNRQVELRAGGSDVFNIVGGNTSIYFYVLFETHRMQYQASTGIWYNVSSIPASAVATGFPGIDSLTPITADNISLDTTTRVLTVTPPLGYFNVFVDGSGKITRYRKGTVNFPAFTDTSGNWYFYFDINGTATVSQTEPTDYSVVAMVASVIWNASLTGTDKAVALLYEAHFNSIPAVDHDWKNLYGPVWNNGFVNINNKLASGTPNADGRNSVIALTTGSNIDDNLKYTITNSTGGQIWQQDLGNTTAASLNATNSALFPIRYQDGSSNSFLITATRFPFAFDSGTNVPQFITATGTRTAVTDKNFFVYYIYSTQEPRNGKALKSVSAPTQFTSLANAQASSWADIVSTYTTFSKQVRPLYKLIYEHRVAYDVGAKFSVLRQVDDIRKAVIQQLTNTAGSLPASSITVVPAGNIASTNVQSALEELDTEKLPIAGGTMTGNLLFTDNTLDIGASGATRPRTGYFGTSVVSPVVNATTGVQINGAAASGKILKADGTNFVASTETYASPGTSGNVMTSDGTNWVSSAPSGLAATWEKLGENTLSSASSTVTVASFSARKNLRIVVGITGTSALISSIYFRCNGDSSSNYSTNGSSSTTAFGTGGGQQAVDQTMIIIDAINKPSFRKIFSANQTRDVSGGATISFTATGTWKNSTDSITTLSMHTLTSDTFSTGTWITIYGSND